MKKALIVAADGYEHTQVLAQEVRNALIDHNVVTHLASELKSAPGGVVTYTPDVVIAIGGDGTIMRALRDYSQRDIPTFGINGGEVGFLAGAEREDWPQAIERLVAGQYEVERRQGLMLTFRGETYGPYSNEVKVIHDRQLMRYKVRINGYDFWHQITALGFLVATATGSNAEHFSKHGDVIFPKSRDFGLIPVGAQKAGSRDAIFSYPVEEGDSTEIILLSGRQRAERADVVADGIDIAVGEEALKPGESILITPSPKPMLAATFGLEQFFRALKEKKGYPLHNG